MRPIPFRPERYLMVAGLNAMLFAVAGLLWQPSLRALSPWLGLGAALLALTYWRGWLGWRGALALALPGAALLGAGLVLAGDGLFVLPAMLAVLALGLWALPWMAVPISADEHLYGAEFCGLVFGLTQVAVSLALLLGPDLLPELPFSQPVMSALAMAGGLLYLITPFRPARLGGLKRLVGLAVTMPLAAGALALGNPPAATAWLIWAGAILLGDLRNLAELRRANERLRLQQERLQALNSALTESEERFRIAFATTPVGMAMLAPDGRIIQANPTLAAMLGYRADELDGMPIADITFGEDLAVNMGILQRVIAGELDHYEMEKRYIHREGHLIWGLLRAAAVRNPKGELLYVVGQVLDITDRRAVEERLRQLADLDALTGIYNRRRFLEEVEWAAALWRRYGTQGAVVLLDLDGFKEVNDRLGHHMGDALLRQVAMSLQPRLRVTDIYGRLGGDEFALYLPGAAADEALQVVTRLLDTIGQVAIRGHFGSVSVTASAGIALLPEDGQSAEQLLMQADRAMYAAKAAGKNRAMLYERSMDAVHNAGRIG